jgi:hypothetical protein
MKRRSQAELEKEIVIPLRPYEEKVKDYSK